MIINDNKMLLMIWFMDYGPKKKTQCRSEAGRVPPLPGREPDGHPTPPFCVAHDYDYDDYDDVYYYDDDDYDYYNQTRRLFGGCTLLNSLRSSHRGERSELDRCSHQTVSVPVWC